MEMELDKRKNEYAEPVVRIFTIEKRGVLCDSPAMSLPEGYDYEEWGS